MNMSETDMIPLNHCNKLAWVNSVRSHCLFKSGTVSFKISKSKTENV